MLQQTTSSSLNEEASRLECQNLIAHADVRRLEPLNDLERRFRVPSKDNSEQKRHDRMAKIGVVATRIARQLLSVGHEHVDVAAALVIRMGDRTEGAVTVLVAGISDDSVVALQGVAVPAQRVSVLFVRPAVLNRDANHPPGSNRDQALSEEQEHGDEFDQSM